MIGRTRHSPFTRMVHFALVTASGILLNEDCRWSTH